MTEPRFFRMTPLNKSGVPRIGFFQSVFVESSDEELVQPRIPKVELEDKGTKWVDFIGDARGHLAFLVSERVIHGLRAAGVDAFHTSPINFSRVPKRLRDQVVSDYFVFHPKLKVSGRIERLGKIDRFDVADHSRILIDDEPPITEPIARYEDSPTIICTWEIVELARTEKWTNIGFHPIDAIRSSATARPPKGTGLLTIDPLSRTWPPERLYSDHHEAVLATHKTNCTTRRGTSTR